MQFTAEQIALMIEGKVEGNKKSVVSSFGRIEEAGAGQLAFLANPKYEEHLYNSVATIIIINESLQLKQPVAATLIRVKDAYSAFAILLDSYQKLKTQQLTGIQQPSYVDTSSTIGDQVFIGAFAYIGEKALIGKGSKIFQQVFIGNNVIIGENCMIYPGVKIYHNCVLGNNVTIHSGTVVGGDGFGFAPLPDGTYKKIPQIGNVIIEDDVEIGANTTIDRATMGSTLIKSGAKLDNLLQIAHNVEIGNNSVIAAQSGISGSTKIGNNVLIGGQAGIVGHIQIADGAKINAQSGVSKSIKIPNSAVTGSPAFEFSATLRSQALVRNLPEIEKRLKELEMMMKELFAKNESL
jgi:UDP-3-O-[3-hydroxymyristoyl] glucosamine N-acyltransferase